MSGSLGEGVQVVGRMTAIREDGGHVEICWLCFDQEPEDEAEAFEVEKGGRLVPLDDVGPWAQWKAVAALAAEGGG